MSEKITWDKFKISDSGSELPFFIENSSFSEFLVMVEDFIANRKIRKKIDSDNEEKYLEEEDEIEEDEIEEDEKEYFEEYDFRELLNSYENKLKFKFNVKFKQNEIIRERILFYDKYEITITDSKRINYNHELKPPTKTNNSIKEKIYSFILDNVSMDFQENANYDEAKEKAFHNALKAINDIVVNRLEKDSEWKDIDDEIKKKLFFRAVILHIQVNVAMPSIFAKFVDNSYHFGPVREEPKSSYPIDENNNFNNEHYYGLLNHIPYKDEKLPFGKADVWDEFLEFISNKENNIGKSIFIEKKENKGAIKLECLGDIIINFADAPSGLIQLFPIIGKLAFSDLSVRERFSIEQPELHLHPKLQSQLIEFLLQNGNFLIETHSEHIIRKLQVMFAKDDITDDDVNINYFDNKNGNTKIKKMNLDENGFFKEPWPDGFFDESLNLTEELLFAPKKN